MFFKVCCFTSVAVTVAAEWVYANPGALEADPIAQQNTWDGLCATGREQSPINIVTSAAVPAPLPRIQTFIDANVTFAKNTGHGFQLFETSPLAHNFTSSDDITPVDGTSKGYSEIGANRFNFYQVHWHTPSENTVDGKSFPLEAHFVHQFDDPALVGTYHRLAVIGLLYELGECNPILDNFWNSFPITAGASEVTQDDTDFNEKLSDELAGGYWHWYGSLTTPPCTETVSWNLLKKTATVCQRQIDRLKEALAATQNGIAFNNRVVQPLYSRVVVETDSFMPAPPPAPSAPPTASWYYANEGASEADAAVQEETWGAAAPLCNLGLEQSPIDIVTADVVETQLPVISTHFSATTEYVKNTGHGFQLFETAPQVFTLNEDNTTMAIDGTDKGYSEIGTQRYNFYQVHWHTPSENTIDGKSFALEAHFVHQFADPDLVGGYNRLAVIGLLYELGECNPLLDEFWSTFPVESGVSNYTGDHIELNDVIANELSKGYYHWDGSLTTPPCTETVKWNLLKTPQTVCQRQVDTLKAALAATQKGVSINNRVVQPMNGRIVTSNVASAGAAPSPSAPLTGGGAAAPGDNGDNGDDDPSDIEIAILALVIALLLGVLLLVAMAATLIKRTSNLHKGEAGTSARKVENVSTV